MRTTSFVSVALGLSLAWASVAPAQTLYTRLGGTPALTAVVDALVTRVAADTRINQKFARTDIPTFKFNLVQQLCHVTGGPCRDVKRSQRRIHERMGVTDGEFDALVQDLVATLNQFKVPAREQNELLGILAPLRAHIVEIHTRETGLPLPASFHPRRPLKEKERRKAARYEARHGGNVEAAAPAAPAEAMGPGAPAAPAEAPADAAPAGEVPPPPPPPHSH